MATTVSVFYDRFNFTETQIAEENKQADSNKLALELLQKKESDLRESIEFKKKDIDETYEGTILLEEDAGAEKILDEVENYFIETVPADGRFEKIIFVFFIRKH